MGKKAAEIGIHIILKYLKPVIQSNYSTHFIRSIQYSCLTQIPVRIHRSNIICRQYNCNIIAVHIFCRQYNRSTYILNKVHILNSFNTLSIQVKSSINFQFILCYDKVVILNTKVKFLPQTFPSL